MSNIDQFRPPSGGSHASTTQKTRQETQAVAQSATDASGGVVQSATEQAKDVASDASRQAQNLYGQARTQVSDQVSAQQKRAADGLHVLSDDVGKMAEKSQGSGVGTQVARQASDKIDQVARWLDNREPRDVVDDVKSYARRNPGTFFLGAAVLGVLAGRLTKNLAPQSGNADDDGAMRHTANAVDSAGSGDPAANEAYADGPPIGAGAGTRLGTPATSATPASYPRYEERS